MYEIDRRSVKSGNMFTLTLATPAPEKDSKEPGDYDGLTNKPTINGVELAGDLSLEDLGLGDVPTGPLTTEDLDNLIDG